MRMHDIISSPKKLVMFSLTIKSERSELNSKRGTICTPLVMPTADWKMRRIQAGNIEECYFSA